ncbi:MAG TPA: TonB-dependent receptor plug domain-containing protein [Longimicrobiales bacterium]|nr:TonB-dependent receptor plug domain-containing protein [Longimicrobiales bacterium]
MATARIDVAMLVIGVALLPLAGCGGQGLPPAGPAPGEVDIGYGTQPADKVSGAVSSLSGDEVGNARPFGVAELLRGRVPGLQIIEDPGGRVHFRIRGTNSILADQEPLFVVDGVQIAPGSVQSALAGLTPESIRQVDVLKDVASTSIYGSRGAGGAILITTRR